MVDGGYEMFGVGSLIAVYVRCVPDFYVVLFQKLLSSVYRNCVVELHITVSNMKY